VVETWKFTFQFKNSMGLYYDETVILKFVYFGTVLMFVPDTVFFFFFY
jgi:hypothetical protein